MKLVIVESPSKAKTIGKYLGKDFVVRASVGHVRDLPKSNKSAIDIPAGFVPKYEVLPKKVPVIAEISKLAKKANEIYLATDPDREGEAIAWHLKEEVKLKKAKRIVFYEITKEAVNEALGSPREVDQNLVKAQEARRVLDRLVGYDLSGVIWKKVRYGLSAGRVQSPALRILMEKEREIRAFVSEKYFVITGIFQTKNKDELVLVCDEEPKEEGRAKEIVEQGSAEKWHILGIEEKVEKRAPKPPFTTATLQQTASTRLSFSPSKTMMVAQKLYEKGLITYMRTDSTNLAKIALVEICQTIEESYGKDKVSVRNWKVKSKNAQEAHEAIRPTHARVAEAGHTPDEKRLYKLIRQRTLASQMVEAEVTRTKVIAKSGNEALPTFSANGSVIIAPGFLLADPEARGEEKNFPKIKINDSLFDQKIQSEEKATQPPGRYTEAGLIKELEKRGIGRASTYASIIATLENRGYVSKNGRTLYPSDTGDVVSSFLEEHFTNYISDTFTAEMEDKLDDIAEGKRDYVKTLKNFYLPFQKAVKEKDKLEKATTLGNAPAEFKCPLCQKEMVVKLGRGGKFLSCSNFPECRGGRTIDGEILAGPKDTGEPCPNCKDGMLIERDGRFGRFIACSRYPKCKFIKNDPAEEAKKKTGVKCIECKDGEMVERRGRFGLFYSCSNYPNCKAAIKAKPTGAICKLCGSLMMEGTKTIPERCSSKTCQNHRPTKKI